MPLRVLLYWILGKKARCTLPLCWLRAGYIQEESVNVVSCTENCIVDIENWLTDNKLSLNAPKSDVISFVSSRRCSLVNGIRIGGVWVPKSSCVRDLGVLLDEGMNMKMQVKMMCKAANASLYKIGRIRKHLDQKSTERLIHAFISSRLDCNNGLLYGLPQKTIAPLQMIQNRAARIVSRTKKRDHITPVLKDLHWLPVKERIEFKILLQCYKVVQGNAPKYLALPLRTTERKIRSSSCSTFTQRKNKTNFGERGFSASGPFLWNRLPVNIKEAENIASFKSLLKAWLFETAFCRR